ncbi:hypothetical protein LIER_34237 [Lithospermum erythrorhizon]|uniref:Uncharacterized protein n=1 Tax=Lithospermum erythrorhizon TaxID=34254 RepID=A0AAV3S2H9_LITER
MMLLVFWLVELPVVEVQAQKGKKKIKAKGKGSKARILTKQSRIDEQVFNPTPIRSIPHADSAQEVGPQNPILYLNWVNYTNVRNLDNPRPDVEGHDADVGGDGSHSAIPAEGDDGGETITPIVEGRVSDSSHADVPDVACLSEQLLLQKPSADDLVDNVTLSVSDTDMEDVGRMEFYVPSATGTKDVTVEFAEDVVTIMLRLLICQKKGLKQLLARAYVRPTCSHTWNLADERQAAGNDEADQGSDDEDVVVVISRRRKAKGKLKINENRTKGTHVPDIPLRAIETGSGSSTSNEETARFIMDEIKNLDGVIQSSLARKSVLEERRRILTREVDPAIDLGVADSEAKASQN